jgi:C_GCAxxG_C_C family probable redox protein
MMRGDRRDFLTAACALAPICGLADPGSPGRAQRKRTPTGALPVEARVDRALRQFGMGFHCAQSVLEVYAPDFGMDPMMARRIANPLAGGSGVGGECGAVASACLILGLRHGNTTPAFGDVDKEAELFARISQLITEFRKRNGAINCRELLGVDLFTKEGRDEASRNNLVAIRCQTYIQDAIEILESLG